MNNFITNYALFLEQSPVYQHITVPFGTLHPTIVRRTAYPVRENVRWTSTDLRSLCNINWNARIQQVSSSDNASPSRGGVRLSPLGTSATNWPIVPAPDDRWWWVWSSRWNENWQGKPKYWERTCSSATLPTTNPTWPDLGRNPGNRGGKPATNCLSYGTASPLYLGCDLVKSRPGHQQSWLRFFVVVLSQSRQMPGYYLKLGHDAYVYISLPVCYPLFFSLTLQPQFWPWATSMKLSVSL
jgi:hypothetical protein